MFLIDTNVVSEIRRPQHANENVCAWFNAQQTTNLYISVVTVLEAEQAYLQLSRRDALQAATIRKWIDQKLLLSFDNRIVDIDVVIAQKCASLHVPNRKPYGDALIAATALVHNLTLITRNVSDFESTGVHLFNPWTYTT